MDGSVEEKSEHAIYKNEILRHRQIRLLTILPRDGESENSLIRCKLKTVRLDDEQPACYTALSYTWGDGKEKVRIEVNGEEFQATRNLHSALEHFRTQDPIPTLWVDAVCINQNHDNEKEAQVQFMQSIFSGAQETWAWLGLEADGSSNAVVLINDLSHIYRNSCQGGDLDPENADQTLWPSLKSRRLENDLNALDHFLTRDYWYRIWIVQEIALSKNLVFFCGSSKFFWNSLLFAVYLLNLHAETSFIHNWSNKKDPLRGLSGGIQRILSLQSVRYDYQENLTSEMRDSLLSLLSNHRSTGASNAKDKFIALAGLAQGDTEEYWTNHEKASKEFQIEIPASGIYTMTEGDVYAFACHLLTKEERYKPLEFLDSAGIPRDHHMASWVPDWSVITQRRPAPLLYWQLATKKHEELVVITAPGKARRDNGPTFSIRGNRLLLAKGRTAGSIQEVITAPYAKKTPQKDGSYQTSHVLPAYPTGEHPADVLWKTLVLDRDLADGLRAPRIWGNIFYQYLAYQPGPSSPPSSLRQWWMQCKHFKLCGSTLEELALARKAPSTKLPSNLNEELAQLKSAFTIAVGYRKLATTQNGFLCLVPLDAKVGDKMVILVDCSAPVLLRQRQDKETGYEFIGTCYVHGIMHGELVDNLDVDDAFPEEFDIR